MTISFSARVTVNGMPPASWARIVTQSLPPAVAKGISDAALAMLLDIERAVKTRTYAASGLHRRSSHLIRNIGSGPQGIRKVDSPKLRGREIQLAAHIGSRVKYARIHEKGGKAGRKHTVTIPARPYLKPAVDFVSKDAFKVIGKRIHQVYRDALRGKARS